MKALPFLLFLIVSCAAQMRAESTLEPVDFEKARRIFERANRGEAISPEEKAYIERAKAGRAKQQGASPEIDWEKAKTLHDREQRGETLAPDEQAYLNKAKAARAGRGQGKPGSGAQRKAPSRLIPLTDMAAGDQYEGEDGGLYGGGSNQPPETQRKTAEAALAQVKPLNAEGKPAGDGRIVFVSISMSNATMEFSTFKRIADQAPQKSDKLTIVDCAQGGQAMAEWVDPKGRPWQEAMQRIMGAEVTPAQVQVAWIKLANKAPSGSKKDHLDKLEADTVQVLQNAKAIFPNLRIAYLGSRIWAGNAKGGLNPEPYAYESAFAVRHLIQQQIQGASKLAAEKSPVLLWGPYLWAEGEKGRRFDDLKWEPGDFSGDGVHPSQSGREKVARLLLDFFSADPLAKSWFAK